MGGAGSNRIRGAGQGDTFVMQRDSLAAKATVLACKTTPFTAKATLFAAHASHPVTCVNTLADESAS